MAVGKRVLIVDDKTLMLELLNEQFQLLDEFLPSVAINGVEALREIKKNTIDVIILNQSSSDEMESVRVCKLLRSNGFRSPIIMLIEAESNVETFCGSNLGANDYIKKPFRLAFLLARIRAHIRQHEYSDDAIIAIGPFSFHPSINLLFEKGTNKSVRLTGKETSILKYLYQVGNKVVERDVLLAEVWGYNSEVSTRTLETHIYRLRQKIEKNPSSTQILMTEEGGYRLAP